MLILTRKIGQSIKIGDEISITVVSMRGDQVRLGIDAPKSIPVDRSEVAERRAGHAHGPQSVPDFSQSQKIP